MKTKRVAAIGGLATADGGAALLIGRLSGSRWACRVVGDGYSPIGATHAESASDGGTVLDEIPILAR